MNVSVMLDGELAPGEVAPTIDHLLSCETCRDFYRSCIALDGILQPLRDAEEARDAHRRHLLPRSWRGRVAAVAAVLVLGLGLGAVLRSSPLSDPSPDTLVVHWAEQRGKMSDDRFLELTKELLEADPRYQWELLDVLRQVQRGAYAEESGRPLLSHRSDTDPGSGPAFETERGAPYDPVSSNLY
jgi:hypothetical protein